MTLQARLSAKLEAGMARDLSLVLHDGPAIDLSALTVPAAVLVAVTDRSEPGVILTQRPDTMRKHPGQVAFPGGRVDPEDADVIAAAAREAWEEIALPPESLAIIGTTDVYRTITGYAVTPVIAVVPPDLPLFPNDDEVAAIFEVPLSFLLDPANHRTVDVMFDGKPRTYVEMHWQDRRIWGATAAMIVNLSRRLSWHD
jgi:8-oxo-dGTP pyrophosphatase MutT (NUDIX family)